MYVYLWATACLLLSSVIVFSPLIQLWWWRDPTKPPTHILKCMVHHCERLCLLLLSSVLDSTVYDVLVLVFLPTHLLSEPYSMVGMLPTIPTGSIWTSHTWFSAVTRSSIYLTLTVPILKTVITMQLWGGGGTSKRSNQQQFPIGQPKYFRVLSNPSVEVTWPPTTDSPPTCLETEFTIHVILITRPQASHHHICFCLRNATMQAYCGLTLYLSSTCTGASESDSPHL